MTRGDGSGFIQMVNDRPLAVAMVCCFLMTLLAGFLLKRQCMDVSWGGDQYRTVCYNEMQALYGVRHLDEHRFPFVEEKKFEYPVVIAYHMWLASLVAEDHREYFLANAPGLAFAATLVLIALFGTLGSDPRILVYASAPPLVLYGFQNWDLFAVACLALSIWAWKENRLLLCGAFIGTGISSKLFTGFALPSLLLCIWLQANGSRSKQLRGVGRMLLGVLAAWGLLNIPVIVADTWVDGRPDGWLGMFTFHTGRVPDYFTSWYWVGSLANLDVIGDGYRRFVDIASLLLFGGWSLYCLVLQGLACRDEGQHRWENPWISTGAILAVFLIVSKVSSPQFSLWLLPILVVCRVPLPIVIVYFVLDVAASVSASRFFADNARLDSSWRSPLGIFILCKLATVGFIARHLVSELGGSNGRSPRTHEAPRPDGDGSRIG